jgi:glyoxylase I family protein
LRTLRATGAGLAAPVDRRHDAVRSIRPVSDPSSEERQRLRLLGLHHVTSICADLARTTAFYRDVLGLALVREGRNEDDPDARHFWFGDAHATAGTLVSFMEYPAMEPGRVGVGSAHHFAFSVGSGQELDAWRDYLRSRDVECTDVFDRGGLRSIYLRDPDGHIVEITTPAA